MPRRTGYRIDSIRELLKERTGLSTVRAVAAEVGMSPSGLHSFLNGTIPYGPVQKKLAEWYRKYAGQQGIVVTAGEADTAFRILEAYLQSGGTLRVSDVDIDQFAKRLRDASDVSSEPPVDEST